MMKSMDPPVSVADSVIARVRHLKRQIAEALDDHVVASDPFPACRYSDFQIDKLSFFGNK